MIVSKIFPVFIVFLALVITAGCIDSKIAMIYNDTNILYLYPSYSIINTEGIYD